MTKPIYSHLSTGKRAGLTGLWNRHHSIDRVARASGVTADVIEAYLNTRDGYPGSITGARPPITLPRVSCLERE